MNGLIAHERVYLALALLAYALFVVSLAASRTYLGYGTETDLVGGFIPEAQRFLSGEPLQSEFHPPLYPIVLGLSYALIGNWMTAGLVISGLSGLVVLAASYFFFQQLCGRAVAWGALLGLFGSSVFLRYSILATSDIFFLALFSTSCLLALRASRTGSSGLWAICGVVVGLTIFTRTNGFTLLLLLLVPFAANPKLGSSLRDVAMGALGLAAVILPFMTYAAATGSHLLPSQTYLTLATTYLTDEPKLWEGFVEAQQRFDNLTEVLTYDPMAIIVGYLRDFYHLVSGNFFEIVALPLALLFPAGLLVLVGRFPNTVFLLFPANVAAQMMLVNFKAFEPRYYLFLVPWIGASVGQLIWLLIDTDWPPLGRRLVAGLSVVVILLSLSISPALTARYLLAQGSELAEALPRVQGQIPAGAAIVARKPHLAFYTGGTPLYMPDLETLADLRDYLRSVETDKPVYVFYGEAERENRPQYMALADPGAGPDWLVEVARSARPGGWALFEYRATAQPKAGER